MKIINLKGQELNSDILMLHTDNMKRPCIFQDVAINQDLESCTKEEILQLKDKSFVSSLHSGSYWDKKPLQAEVQGRKIRLNLERMFLGDEGHYYVTYFKVSDSHPIVWSTARTCGNNSFDDYLASKTKFKDYMKGAYLHNHWVSNGGTLSSLHADPVDTVFLQVKGAKTLRLIPESLRLCLYADLKQPHKLIHTVEQFRHMKLGFKEILIKPGNAVFMPAWCFHEIESEKGELNISLTSHFQRKRKGFAFSIFKHINDVRRKIYPKLVNKKRIAFQLENLSGDSIPFFPWHTSYVNNLVFQNDTSYQYENLILNRKKRVINPIQNESLKAFLKEIDGFKNIKDIAKNINFDVDMVIHFCYQLIQDEFIQILFEADDKYNYFYQSIEARR
ncbi:cupin-like domain-containing protein [Yersinia thracica]|uniref:cupin-like domain-containing protein n=1 Tax=Yersinia thracica TaxID=2890319 RepID=UPI00119FA809|nr:cupin-like domain-containing protein [Yersinia thracica]